ncbi:hypothetical protein WOLCODRAFT_138335, partial [Wolfiporia cocos MD-104 SS10]
MPASDLLLASFLAHWSGRVARTTINNWLAGLRFWHIFNGAPWNGGDLVRTVCKTVTKEVPQSSKRDRRHPVTLEHMHTLRAGLDLSNAFDAAVYACACVAFWSICRLGEVVIPSSGQFNTRYHARRDAPLRFHRLPGGSEYATLHIPWTKTTHSEGADIVISSIDDPTNPIIALRHHMSANCAVPNDAPLFAFETHNGGWVPLTRGWFLERCNEI